MVSKISFGSTFKISSSNNSANNYAKFKAFAANLYATDRVYVECKDKMESRYPYEYKMDCTVVAPNYFDDKIERYCANNGIKYSKLSPSMEPNALKARIEDAPKNKIKVNINAEKLEHLIKNQQTNIYHCKRDYTRYYHDKIHVMLKKGEKFPTSTLYISADNPDSAVSYIKKFGADLLNDNQLFIGFTQRTLQPEHCVYFALRNSGMKNVPVYVDATTHKIGEALGIFE